MLISRDANAYQQKGLIADFGMRLLGSMGKEHYFRRSSRAGMLLLSLKLCLIIGGKGVS
jgi:hypothetical protein